jgi:hypothetical protein
VDEFSRDPASAPQLSQCGPGAYRLESAAEPTNLSSIGLVARP